MKEGVMNLFSIEKGSAFMKGALSILLMSNFLPNYEYIALLGKIIMSLGGAVMLAVSIFQGWLNIQKTKLENRYKELQINQLRNSDEFKRVDFDANFQKKIDYDADSIESDESENGEK